LYDCERDKRGWRLDGDRPRRFRCPSLPTEHREFMAQHQESRAPSSDAAAPAATRA
jgi:hypothetical protein